MTMRRIPLKTSALLSMLTAVASLTNRQQSSSRSLSYSNNRMETITFTTRTGSPEALTNSVSPRGRRLVRSRPPLVDSNLLRFLKLQQQQPFQVQSGEYPSASSRGKHGSSSSSTDRRLDVGYPLDSSMQSTGTGKDNNMSCESFVNEDEVKWIAQYERSSVASLLNSAGSDVALEAGIRVESMAVDRAAQRRVRCFLKQRNNVWGAETKLPNERTDSCTINFCNVDNMKQVHELLLQYGFSAKDICEILIHTPSIAFMQPRREDIQVSNLGESLEDTLDRAVSQLLMGRSQTHELGLRKYDTRKVVRNTPGLLTVRGSHSATKMAQMLTSLGVSSNSLARDKNALPVLLSRDPAAVFRLVAFLSSDVVRMPMDKIGPLLRRTDCQDLLNAIAPVPEGWKLGQLSKRDGSLAVAAQVQREVVNNVYRRMSQTAQTLRNEIGTHDLGKVIAAYPSVLLLDASRQILPVAHYLMNELGIWQDDLPSVLQLYPSLLRMDVEQMKNVASYLVSLEVSEDNLGTIFRSFPSLLTLDIEHDMEPVVAYLRSIGISNIGRFVSRLPPVLGYSVDGELKPKFEFLSTVCTDARFEVSKFPAFFSYPLERVIKTRYEYLRDVKRIPTPLLALDHVLCSGDKDFAMRVARDPDGSRYARFVEDRRKVMASPQLQKLTAESKPPRVVSGKNSDQKRVSSQPESPSQQQPFPTSIAVITS